MDGRGLDHDGTIAREGSLERVPATFSSVVDGARARITETFGPARLHSAYLYGSIPRGTAIPGVSDLDLMLALRADPTEDDRSDAARVETALDDTFPQIDGVGILLAGADTLLSDAERYDGGFFVACLCTPLIGDDLAERLPSYRPTSLLARETNGDLATVLRSWRARAAEMITDDQRRVLVRSVARRIVRTGFTLVMPRWSGWTSDLATSAEIFGRYYPECAERMHVAAAAGRTPSSDESVLGMLVDDLGPWLATEYSAVHGTKTPRSWALGHGEGTTVKDPSAVFLVDRTTDRPCQIGSVRGVVNERQTAADT